MEFHNEVTIINAEGPFEPSPEAPAVKIEQGNLPQTVKIVPVDAPEGPVNGPMAGGCFVATHDSRFTEAIVRLTNVSHFYGAVALHDRYEKV